MEERLPSNELNVRISAKELLVALLETEEFKGFKDSSNGNNPDGDYRDPSEKNPSLTLSSKGWYDHRTGGGGSLFELAKDKGLLEQDKKGNWRLKKDVNPSHLKVIDGAKSKTVTKKQGSDPQKIWTSSKGYSAFTGALKSYIAVDRKIPNIPESWEYLIRGNDSGIIIPMLNVDQTLKALKGEDFKVEKINTIYIQPELKGKKRQLGSTESPSMTIFPPPVLENLEKDSRKLVVFEGFENALSIASIGKFNDCYFGVAHGKNNLSSVSHFTANLKIQEVFIFAENDEDKGGLKAAKKEQKRLHQNKIECVIYHPREVGLDANKSLQNGRLLGFIDECEVLEFEELEFTENQEITVSNCEEEDGFFTDLLKESKKNRKRLSYLIKGVIPQSSIVLISGQPSTYKSFIVLSMAAAISNGIDWHCMKTKNHGPAIYFNGEGSNGMIDRMNVLSQHLKLTETVHVNTSSPDFTNEKYIKNVIDKIEQFSQRHGKPPAVVVIDTLSNHFRDEKGQNSDVAMEKFCNGCKALRDEFGCSVIIVHHLGKNEEMGPRGSSALVAAVDVEFRINRPNEQDSKIEMYHTKMKDGPNLEVMHFEFKAMDVTEDGSEVYDEDNEIVRSGVLEKISPSEVSKSPPAENNNKSKGRPSSKVKIALEVFRELKKECGDQDVHLDVFRNRLKENHPKDFDTSAKWRDLKEGKGFKESFEFSEEDNWIRLKDPSNEE
jgi:archaellum biogenesis ATPase FlaH/riboflavin synthase